MIYHYVIKTEKEAENIRAIIKDWKEENEQYKLKSHTQESIKSLEDMVAEYEGRNKK
ncbi:MAG: hypothetical protein Q8876_07330 [Bacillota bacterium]|nr:hypothetical protein [Bacillota bacterium]